MSSAKSIPFPSTDFDSVDELFPYFDRAFYLAYYPDVANAGVDPWQHYQSNGLYEKRLPMPLSSFDLEETLWSTQAPESLAALETLFESPHPYESAIAGWALARWYGSYGDWARAEYYLYKFFAQPFARQFVPGFGPHLLYFASLYHQDKRDLAGEFLASDVCAELRTIADGHLALSMLHNGRSKIEYLSMLWKSLDIVLPSTERFNHSADMLSFDDLPTLFYDKPASNKAAPSGSSVVSVIIPCYNCADTIKTALLSLVQQTWPNLEIIAVDDASSDATAAVISAFSDKHPCVKLYRHLINQGAYAARNTGASMASGDYITVHDADDWSHPSKIELQVNALEANQSVQATVSHWVRTSDDLSFQRWRAADFWIYRNVSSLMIRRDVFEALGYWDRVSVNADTEYFHRILTAYGEQSIEEVESGIPLAFGRVLESALTSQSATHLRTQFKGLRKVYHEAAQAWHESSSNLYMPQFPKERVFSVPNEMCRRLSNSNNRTQIGWGAVGTPVGFIKQAQLAADRGDMESACQFYKVAALSWPELRESIGFIETALFA